VSHHRRSYELDVIIEDDVPAANRFKDLRRRAYALHTSFSSEYGATSKLRTYKIVMTGQFSALDRIEDEYPELRPLDEPPNAPFALNHLRPLP